MNALHKQQQAFVRYINGVDEEFSPAIKDNGLGGARRLKIYRNSVTIGLCDALGGVYGVVKKLVDDEFFTHVAKQYLYNHPSQTSNVHDYGAFFAEFLTGFPGLESLDYLPDVARLEWLYHCVFHSPVDQMLDVEELAQVPSSHYDRLRFQLSPFCHLFSSKYPVLRIWQVNQDEYGGNDAVNLNEGGVYLAVVRDNQPVNQQIAFHTFTSSAYAMLEAIADGQTFNQACNAALEIEPDCDIDFVIQQAVMHRMITGFVVNEH